jgi:hypothetical protein
MMIKIGLYLLEQKDANTKASLILIKKLIIICADHRHHFNYMMNYDAQNKGSFRVGQTLVRLQRPPASFAAVAVFPDRL